MRDEPCKTLAESTVLTDDAIPLTQCARRPGLRRRSWEAIKLLFRACRFADDEGEFEVTEQHVRDAHEYAAGRLPSSAESKSLPLQRALALLTRHARDSNRHQVGGDQESSLAVR